MTAWQKGQSGNPKGRPPRDRVLSAILARKADDPVGDSTHKERLAELLWHFVTYGEVQLGDVTVEAKDVGDWLSVVKWIYAHLDGPASTSNSDDNEMVVRVVREDRPTMNE